MPEIQEGPTVSRAPSRSTESPEFFQWQYGSGLARGLQGPLESRTSGSGSCLYYFLAVRPWQVT